MTDSVPRPKQRPYVKAILDRIVELEDRMASVERSLVEFGKRLAASEIQLKILDKHMQPVTESIEDFTRRIGEAEARIVKHIEATEVMLDQRANEIELRRRLERLEEHTKIPYSLSEWLQHAAR